jgi:hypothetical protein
MPTAGYDALYETLRERGLALRVAIGVALIKRFSERMPSHCCDGVCDRLAETPLPTLRSKGLVNRNYRNLDFSPSLFKLHNTTRDFTIQSGRLYARQ